MAFEKALIVDDASGELLVTAMFNPEEYTVNRDNNFAQIAVPGLRAPLLQFVHGSAQTLDMELLLDTVERHDAGSRRLNEAGDDVRPLVRRLIGLLDIDPATHAPPVVKFVWASFSFTCVLTRAVQKYTMFRTDGAPVRAKVQVTFTEFTNAETEAKEIKRETADFTQVHTVAQGDSLPSIAFRFLGNPAFWRAIAIANQLEDPGRLVPGAMLVIPRLPFRDPETAEVDRAVSNTRLAPDARITANGDPLPAAMRASVSRIALQQGLEGADRLELTLVNEHLLWLDHPQLALGREIRLSLGYAPDPLEQVFVGDIVGLTPAFPADGVPTLTVIAHDRRARLQRGTKTRWFAIAIPRAGNHPIPDRVVVSLVAAQNHLLFASDPVSLAISAALGGVEYGIRAATSKGKSVGDQELVRKQQGETDLAFLGRIASENGWVMSVDHGGALGGNVLRFTSPLSHLLPDVTLRYGANLVDFTPRISTVGEIASVTVRFWIPQIKVEMTVTASWDWDRQSLSVSATPSSGGRGGGRQARVSPASTVLVGQEVSARSASRVLLAKLLGTLNQRLTGTASTVGDLRFRPGGVVQLEGVGRLFGGAYRVTGVNHTLDAGGFRTSIEVRKEVWFDGAHLMRGFEGAALAAASGPLLPLLANQ